MQMQLSLKLTSVVILTSIRCIEGGLTIAFDARFNVCLTCIKNNKRYSSDGNKYKENMYSTNMQHNSRALQGFACRKSQKLYKGQNHIKKLSYKYGGKIFIISKITVIFLFKYEFCNLQRFIYPIMCVQNEGHQFYHSQRGNHRALCSEILHILS